VDRTRPLTFEFDGRSYSGLAGDTLASALLASGVTLVGRSFKYHRPRGLFAAGLEEPNALVRLGRADEAAPNIPATTVELEADLVAESQNRWPSLRFDLLAVNQLAAPVLSAGFYYKTFIWPSGAWPLYEHFIRRAAGLGRMSSGPPRERCAHIHAECDVLVVGGGRSGLSAALGESETGASVLLAEADFVYGGSSLDRRAGGDGPSAAEWAAQAVSALASRPNVRLLPRTLAYGAYEAGIVQLVERQNLQGERLWSVKADRILLATGAHEQPLAFENNDRPGVMLCSAVRTYLNRFGVAPGRRAVVVSATDEGLEAALDLAHAGVEVCAVVDLREDASGVLAGSGLRTIRGRVMRALGAPYVQGLEVDIAGGGRAHIACDLLAVSGGFAPALHLATQGAGAAVTLVGRAARPSSLHVPSPAPRGKCVYVDLQNDVSAADIFQAESEGYRSAELLKRYTTLGMGTDQGKTSNALGWSLLAKARGGDAPPVQPTRKRPPYAPVSLGVLAGPEAGPRLKPLRRTAMDAWHASHGAEFVNAGLWRRPRYYRSSGPDLRSASIREATAVRTAAGLADISTLGKIELCGPDVLEFLDRVYVSRWRNPPLRRARYGVMLREDGLVFDDGTAVRLDEHRVFLTTTTAHAAQVLAHLERHLQVVWPELRVRATCMTERWAAMALAGPASRRILAAALEGLDISADAFPHQSVGEGSIDEVGVRVARMSFSGELCYEVYAPWSEGPRVWSRLLAAGAGEGLAPYGLEAMAILRIEAGHLGDGELDGRTTLADLRLERMLAPKDCIGARLARRPALADPDRQRLVGLTPVDGVSTVRAGAQLVASRHGPGSRKSVGRVCSAAFSPTLGRPIALCLLAPSVAGEGDTVFAASPLHGELVAVRVGSPQHVRPQDRSLND
jgi:sarcosine oxidase subunit alpha